MVYHALWECVDVISVIGFCDIVDIGIDRCDDFED